MKFVRREEKPNEFVSTTAVLKSKFKPAYFLKGAVPASAKLLKVTDDKVIYTNESFLVEVGAEHFYGCPPAGVYEITGLARSAAGWDTVLASVDKRYPTHERVFPEIPSEKMVPANMGVGIGSFMWTLAVALGAEATKIGGYNHTYIEAMEAWLSISELGVDKITYPMLVVGARGRGCIMPMTA